MMNQNPVLQSTPPAITVHEWFDRHVGLRAAFLARHGWQGVTLEPVAEDGAFRRYFRLRRDGRTVILMETVPASSPIATPGHRMDDFIRLGGWLRNLGINTPKIYQSDEIGGYMLLEDFGDLSFKRALENGVDPMALYTVGVDVLQRLGNADPTGMNLPRYYDSLIHANRRRVVDWYMPAVRGQRNPDGLAESYLAVWDAIERSLPPCPQTVLHHDFHVENLMWLPDRQGLQQCGVLDYQWAMTGPAPYDLINFLEDARMDVAPEIREAMLTRFCANMDGAEAQIFRAWYLVLATQFHCRIIGQFIRLAVRDGKMRYLPHMPRLAAYLRAELNDPLLRPLRDWFVREKIDFSTLPVIDVESIRSNIRTDAF
jgi:aminoglycoside/choline kinase family phosphotransferase